MTRVSVFWRLLAHHQATSSNGSIFTYTHSVRCILLPYSSPVGIPLLNSYKPLGVLAAGFLMRPIGGWMFGYIADKHGRRTSMMISVCMMCCGSLVIACLPTYAAIGNWAPALLLLARLFQGLSVGGEYGTSATYMSEVAVEGKRGFYASFQYVTLIGGQLLALLVLVVLQQTLSTEELRCSLGLASAVCTWRAVSGGCTLSAPFPG